MRELVLYYSYSGNTKKIAEKFGEENKFEICEAADSKRPNKFAVFTAGIVKSLRGSSRKIKPIAIGGAPAKFEDYDAVNVFCPIWAGHPAPSANAAIKLLPKGTKIKLFMVSQSGKSEKENISKRVADLGLEILAYEDIKN
ncbi:MAG: hypothetical protein FWG34_05635 [Oscillospiraceae bacterium]|nr:hypothetical protein [Oscillospiraceae bacterium]